MGFFKRKGSDTTEATTGSSSKPRGRHLHSDADEATCIENFRALIGLPESSYFTLQWQGSADKAPSTLLGVYLDEKQSQACYLAIWPKGGYQEGAGYQEMALIPPTFDPNVPVEMVGQWKMRDSSLKSIGHTNSFPVG